MDKAAASTSILRILVNEEEKYIEEIKGIIEIVERQKNITPDLMKKIKHAFVLMQYMFIADLGRHLSNTIDKKLKNLSLSHKTTEKIKDYLTQQKTMPPSQEEDINLIKIAKLFKTIHKNTSVNKYNQLSSKIKLLLENHQSKYSWTPYSGIDTKPYSVSNLFDRFKELLRAPNLSENSESKQKEIKIDNLKTINKKDILYFKLAKKYIYLDNYAASLYQYLFFLTMKLIKKKFKVTYKDITWYSFQEIEKLVQNNKKIPKTSLDKRRKHRAMVQISEKVDFFYEKDEIDRLKKFVPKIQHKITKIIHGTVASMGKAKGNVVIVKDVKDMDKMKQGNILVAPNTRPELIVAMRKASAIITDWGGITSHAAIISREFRIPCIVGTDIATQVLKDGDLVEVDANKGVVKVIERMSVSAKNN